METGIVRHIVVFRFTPGAPADQIDQIMAAVAALPGKIPGILSYEHGVNNSPEGKNQGFTHVFTMTFENAAARDAYLPHPQHAEFGGFLRSFGILDDVFVVDYTPQN